MVYDGYEYKIMRLLRQDPTKTYTEEQISLKVVGKNTELLMQGYNLFEVDAARRAVSEALVRLVQKGEAHKKEYGTEAVYGIQMSLAEKAKLRIDKSDASNKVRRSGMSLDRRVKGIHRNWLTLVVLAVSSIIAVIIAIRFP